ncbi:hypothetical protein QVD17_02645 [Tagetes erecta]|uniref:Uncharacterized protein n=1 Tax=Tagetes erecta TaxID=13708 RepID=A0AAD8P9C9_TARER|nr:hypothetical protein QVD17_02645 [Tagetes erecta]
MMMKRVKIAGKPFQRHQRRLSPYGEYEFSCSNTPRHPLSLFSTCNKHKFNNCPLQRLPNPKQTLEVDDCDDITMDPAFIKVLNDILITSPVMFPSDVEQLKIMESSFSVADGLDDDKVDEAAEKFIRRFYNDLRRENM